MLTSRYDLIKHYSSIFNAASAVEPLHSRGNSLLNRALFGASRSRRYRLRRRGLNDWLRLGSHHSVVLGRLEKNFQHPAVVHLRQFFFGEPGRKSSSAHRLQILDFLLGVAPCLAIIRLKLGGFFLSECRQLVGIHLCLALVGFLHLRLYLRLEALCLLVVTLKFPRMRRVLSELRVPIRL